MTDGISSATGTNYLSMLQSAVSSSSSSETDETEETKSTQEILTELKQSATSSTMSAQDIADEYNISLAKAQEILKELQGDSETSGYTADNPTPDGSTVSYHV